MKKLLSLVVLLLATSCASTVVIKRKMVSRYGGGYMVVQCAVAADCVDEVVRFCDRSTISSYSIELDESTETYTAEVTC